MFNFLAGPFSSQIESTYSGSTSWFKPVVKVLDSLIWPITIIAFIAGAIWIIWLGVKLAKAEDDSKQKEAKKALINVAVALVSVLVLFWVLVWVAANIESWVGNNNPFESAGKSDLTTSKDTNSKDSTGVILGRLFNGGLL